MRELLEEFYHWSVSTIQGPLAPGHSCNITTTNSYGKITPCLALCCGLCLHYFHRLCFICGRILSWFLSLFPLPRFFTLEGKGGRLSVNSRDSMQVHVSEDLANISKWKVGLSCSSYNLQNVKALQPPKLEPLVMETGGNHQRELGHRHGQSGLWGDRSRRDRRGWWTLP